MAVRRDRVDPWRAEASQRLAHVRDAAGSTIVQPLVEAARVAAIGVLQREGDLVGPIESHARRPDHGSVPRAPQPDAADLACGHLLGAAVDEIARWIAVDERQLVKREALAGRHGVAPRDVLVEADHDGGETADRDAHHVEAAWN